MQEIVGIEHLLNENYMRCKIASSHAIMAAANAVGRLMQCRRLVLVIKILLTLSISSLSANFFVILLEGSKILAGFAELTLLHTLSNVPMDEGTLCVHEIELMINTTESLRDGRGVGNHTNGALNTGKVSSRNHSGRLVVDSTLETSRTPVNKLNGPLSLDGGHSSVDILGHDISSVHEAARHVLAVARIALGHGGLRLEDRRRDLGHGEVLVVGLLRRDDGRVRGEHEVDAGVGHQVRLELGHVDIKRAVEAKGGREGGGDLGNEAIEIGVGGTLYVEATLTDVVQGLVVEAEGDVRVLQESVGGKDGVVWLDHGGGHLGRGRYGERELGLATEVHGQTLQEEGAEAGSGSAASGVEDEESLQACAIVGHLADPVRYLIHYLLADGVMSPGVVVGRILLPADDLLGMVELAIRPGTNLVADGGFEIDVDGAGDVFPSARLTEEGVEGVVSASDGLVGRHLTIGLDAVFEAVEFPAAVTGLDTGLADMDGDTFAHDER
mmetsp:Transcript_23795/g.51450  ORF Transcript_23795/g.51450 Transcript_23795/m.51450 type:complete len:498 (+) Transcript_23795:382-1875(+)